METLPTLTVHLVTKREIRRKKILTFFSCSHRIQARMGTKNFEFSTDQLSFEALKGFAIVGPNDGFPRSLRAEKVRSVRSMHPVPSGYVPPLFQGTMKPFLRSSTERMYFRKMSEFAYPAPPLIRSRFHRCGLAIIYSNFKQLFLASRRDCKPTTSSLSTWPTSTGGLNESVSV